MKRTYQPKKRQRKKDIKAFIIVCVMFTLRVKLLFL